MGTIKYYINNVFKLVIDIYFLKLYIYVFIDFFVEYHRLSGSCMVNN